MTDELRAEINSHTRRSRSSTVSYKNKFLHLYREMNTATATARLSPLAADCTVQFSTQPQNLRPRDKAIVIFHTLEESQIKSGIPDTNEKYEISIFHYGCRKDHSGRRHGQNRIES